MDRPTRSERLLCSILSGTATCDADLARLSEAGWDDLLRQAAQHGVTPFVYRHLRTRGPAGGIPTRVQDRLRDEYYRGATRNARIYHILTEVFGALRDAGIPVIALKGAHLAEVVYRNIALRSLGDVDLLVGKPDLAGAAEALGKIGYRPSLPFRIDKICAMSQHLPPFTKAGAPMIEMHWTISSPDSPFRIDLDGLWRRAQPADMNGTSVLVLSPEDLLLHLCLHACFQHRLTIGLRALCDVAAVIQHHRDELDWEQVAVRAGRCGGAKSVYLTLLLANESVGAAAPAEVMDALAPGDLGPEIVAWAREQLFRKPPNGSLPITQNLARMWHAHGLRGKLAGFFRSVFLTPETMATMYPAPPSSKRIYLYYPVRLKDVLLRYGPTAWRLLRRDEATLASARREENGNVLADWLASP